TGLFDEDLRSRRGPAGASIQSLEFYETDESRGFARGARWLLMPTGGPMRAALTARPGGAWGIDHHMRVRERFGRSARWSLLCEDLPRDDNRVVLSSTTVDSSGIPVPKLVYAFDDNTLAMRAWHEERARESLLEAGAWHVDIARPDSNGHF